jgi:tetratricopeptide (TPR) repeat protein
MLLLAAGTSASHPEVGAAFWALILAFVAARRARAMGEPGANRKGYTAALLLWCAWGASVFGYYLTTSGMPGLAVLFYLATFVGIVIGVFLAVGALLEIRADPVRYTSGKAQAVRALVSAGIYVSIFLAAGYAGFRHARGQPPFFSAADGSKARVEGSDRADASRRAEPPRKPVPAFSSKDFDYAIDLGGYPWTEWRNIAEREPRAEFGAFCGDKIGITIEPVPLLGHKPPAADTDQALLSLMDLEHEKPLQRLPIERGDWRGFESSFERAVDGTVYRYRVWTLVGANAGMLAGEWRSANAAAGTCSGALEKLRLGRPPPIRQESVPRPAAVAHFFNHLGLTAFRDGRFAQAREAFEQAHALAPQDLAYAKNVVGTMRREGNKQAALDWLGRELKGASCSAPLRATQAFNLADLGKVPEALATWSSLFGCGYLDDAAFEEYAHFLESHGKVDLAVKEAAAYAARYDSVSIALLRAELLARKGERDNAIALLQERQAKKGFDSGIAYRLAELALDTQHPAEAVRLCEEMVSRGFASKGVRVLEARAEYRLKWYARAKASLELALNLDPADEDTHRFLDHVSAVLGEGKNSAVKDPIDPVPLPAALSAAAPEPDERGHSASYLLRATAISFVKGKELRTTEYRRIRVLDETGVSRFSTFNFGFDPLSEALYVNKLEVKNASGALVTASASDTYLSDDASEEMGTQRRTLFVPVPGLRPGSTVELVLTRRDLFPPERMEFSEHRLSISYPVARSALFLRGDVHWVESRTSAGLTPRRLAEGLAWVVESPPVYRREPLQPSAEEFLPTVWLGDASGTWEAVGKEYLASLGKLLAPDPSVRDLLKKMDRSPAGLARFVQKELTYKAIEFGRGARIPRPPGDVLRRRYGDCKDHALLLAQLLGGAGVPARLALVRTGGPLRREMPSLDQFDHLVVYLPAQDLFVDATAKSADLFRGVTSGIAGKDALVLDPKQPRVVRIPDQGADGAEMSLVREVHLVAGADLEVTETATYRGNEAATMRGYFDGLEPKARPSAVQRWLSSYGHEVEVLSLEVRDLREPHEPLAVQFKYVQRSAFHAVGGQLVGKLPALLERARLQVEADSRETPFQFRLPLLIHSTVSLELPDGYSPAQPLVARASADERFAGWRVSPDQSAVARELRARFAFGRKLGRHASSEYVDLRRDTETALGALEQEVVLQRVTVGRAD